MSLKTVAKAGAPGRAPAGRRAGRPGRSNPDGIWPVVFVLPLFLGVAVFYLFPIIQTAYFSFTTWGVFGGSTFTGLENYSKLATDPQVGRALLNTLIYTVVVLAGVPIAVGLASLVNRPGLRFSKTYRTMFFLPYVAMPVAISMVWRMIYNGDFGVLNYFLSLFGVLGPHWVSTDGLALISVALLGLWISIGFNMIILSAGLKGIPVELYEAASIDGASRFRQFRQITVPLLTPSIFFVMVINIINGFQLFDLLYTLLGTTNPAMARSQSLVYLFYNESFIQNDKGYGAAIAILVLVLVGIFTAVQFRFQRRWVNYV
ncbi:carbohydrate ABC transporter permease [Arthrobacter sp. A2-55]|uniref:carbohydrate ABC transporter permease n=1 Tax=Arthrobacter sp. A2-55 TaxID=2897337 RepID=UPI0021CD3C7D|nr:sugar ABC transporter permease [Arthrobacter sp. A2-55]MCU6481706.1 sugar ABC transporter permease [Arthrobacter sp. A2-55]